MPVASHPIKAVEIFCSYSHLDEALRDELAAHLSSLKREGVKHWHDRMIKPGGNWKGEIHEHLDTAHIILLLISADFLKSDYCYDIEMRRAMERHEAGKARVIPIILRPCDWETSTFGKLQALPNGAAPVTEWPNRDSALRDVAKGIRAVVEELLDASSSAATSSAGGSKSPPRIFIPRAPAIGFVARRDTDGRDIVERLKERLAPQPQGQLVTLSGPGGIGKTTLAAEAARELEKTFGGRVVWSSADGRADFTLSTLLDDTATQLGREDLRPLAPDAKEAAAHALVADPPTLVVLDNYETIKPDAQQRIEAWFKDARCSALFTSRQRIGATVSVAVAAMSREEAEEFLQRTIEQTQDAKMFSAEIRRRVYETAEANPFVMQWVVAQLDAAQEPHTVLEELQHGTGDAAERVFDRSFNLPQLGDDGRAALLALSLFAPSAARNALADVAGFGDDSQRLREAVKNLRALWLIKALDQNSRFAVEGLTRSLAAARLSKDPCAAEFRQRFVACFLSYAETHAQTTPEDFAALEADKDNALNAMDAAFEMNDWDSVIQIHFALEEFLDMRGYWDEAIQRGVLAVKAARNSQSDDRLALLLHNLAVIFQRRGELDEARRLYNESLAINKRLDNQSGIACTLHNLAAIAQSQGEIEEARGLYNESLEIEKRLGDQSGIASTLHQLGRLAQSQGEIEEARGLYNESLAIAKRLGDQSSIASTLHNLAAIAQSQGEVEEARGLYNESLAIKKRLGNQSGIASTSHQLATLAQSQGEVEEARGLYNESLEIKKKLGDQSGIAITLHQLAMLAHEQGEIEEARGLYNESLAIGKRLGDQSGIAITLHELGSLAQSQGEIEEARGLYNESLEIEKRLGNQSGIAISLHALAVIAGSQGNFVGARQLYEESLEISKRLGDKSNIGLISYNVGLLAEKEGNREEAVRLMREVLSIFEKLKSPYAEMARRNLERLEGESS